MAPRYKVTLTQEERKDLEGISSKYPPAKPGALIVNRSKRWAQTMGRLKAAS